MELSHVPLIKFYGDPPGLGLFFLVGVLAVVLGWRVVLGCVPRAVRASFGLLCVAFSLLFGVSGWDKVSPSFGSQLRARES